MKKLLLISMFAGMLPMTLVAQDDDLYFVPKKKSVEKVTDNYGMPTDVYYSGSDRSIDEYNRRLKSRVEVIGGDSTLNDTISFSAEKGVYPTDSVSDEDFKITKEMSRFDDYRISDNEAFWAGYAAGRYDWAWHSPWYYTRYGWYDPWYYGRWGWYDPWYYGYGWYTPWYTSWYSPFYYGWYDPWYYGYSWYGPRYYPMYGSVSVVRHHANTIGAGTIRRDGRSYADYRRPGSSSRYSNSSRMNSELRNRTVNGNSRNGRVNRENSSRTYEYSRSNNGNYNNNSGSFSGSRSNGGSFSGGSRSSGGFSGGSRSGGGRIGGRR